MVKGKIYNKIRSGIDRIVSQDKNSLINISISLYVIVYLLIGIGGISFQVQPAIGYIDSITNNDPPVGSTWVEGESLHWADGNKEYFTAEGQILSAWSFSEGSGSTAYEEYQDYDGSINSATWTSGYYGDGLNFDGSDDYVDLQEGMFTPGTDLTVSMWLNPGSSNSGTSNTAIFELRDNRKFSLRHDRAADGDESIDLWVDGTYHENLGQFDVGTWQHITLAYESDSNQWRIYKNGSEISSFTDADGSGGNGNWIGVDDDGSGSQAGNNWEGRVDEVKVYGIPLNDEQVKEMYDKGRDHFRAIKGNWRFDSSYETSWEGSDPEWSCYTTAQSPSTCSTSATDYATEGSESVKVAKGDGLCGYGGMSREFTKSYETLSLDTRVSVDNWASAELMIENSTGVYDIKRWSGGGSSFTEGWTRYSFDVSDAGSNFKFIIGNHDDGGYCDYSDHGFTIWADNLTATESNSIQTAKDSSGWENDGTINGATWTSGKRGKALSFDGTGDYVDIDGAVSATDAITISMWTKGGSSQPAQDSILEAYDSSGNRVINIHLPWDDGTVYWDFGDSSYERTSVSPSGVNWQNWNHWTFVADSNSPYMDIYLNGDRIKHDTTVGKALTSQVSQMAIGSYADGGNQFYDGIIDELRIYERPLSQDEIQKLYEGAGSISDGPVGSTWIENSSLNWIDESGFERSYLPSTQRGAKAVYHMDEGSGSTVSDSSSHGNDGTINGAFWTAGRFGQGLEFNGDDHAVVSNFVEPDDKITVSAWLRPSEIAGDNRQWLVDDNTGSMRSYIRESDSSISWNIAGNEIFSNTALSTGQWYLVTMTFDPSTNSQKLYINGNLDNSASNSGSISSSNDNLYIGYDGFQNYDWYEGKIDELRIYDRALSSQEIKRLNQGFGSFVTGASPGSTWMESKANETIKYDFSNGMPADFDHTASYPDSGTWGRKHDLDGGGVYEPASIQGEYLRNSAGSCTYRGVSYPTNVDVDLSNWELFYRVQPDGYRRNSHDDRATGGITTGVEPQGNYNDDVSVINRIGVNWKDYGSTISIRGINSTGGWERETQSSNFDNRNEYYVRIRSTPSETKVKYWQVGNSEPSDWQHISSLDISGRPGFYSVGTCRGDTRYNDYAFYELSYEKELSINYIDEDGYRRTLW